MKKQMFLLCLVSAMLFNGFALAAPTVVTLRNAEIFLTNEGYLAISENFFGVVSATAVDKSDAFYAIHIINIGHPSPCPICWSY